MCNSRLLLVRCLARGCAPLSVRICLSAATLLVANVAHAQRIILLCPPEADTSLTEAFNRLRGELSMHGFEVEIQTSAEAISAESLASRADSVAAVASVAFVRSVGGHATADIKISDRVTGKMTTRTIATPEGMDAASLLALRAVELLRASLREFGPAGKAPKDIIGAAPDRATPNVSEFAEPKPAPPTARSTPAAPPASPAVPIEPAVPAASSRPSATRPLERAETRWSARADLLVTALFPGAHAAYGAGVTLGFRPSPRFEAQLAVEAPWSGTQYTTDNAKSEVQLFTTAGAIAMFVPVSRYAELHMTGGLGLTRMTLFTTTVQPLLPLLPSAWVFMPRLSAGVSVPFSPHFFWHTSVTIAALLPRVRLHLEERAFSVGLPILQVSSGLGMRF